MKQLVRSGDTWDYTGERNVPKPKDQEDQELDQKGIDF